MNMLHLNLIRKITVEQWKFFLLSFLFLFAFGYANTWFVAAMNTDNVMAELMRQVPKMFRSSLGLSETRRITNLHFIILAFTHPIPLAVILSFGIGLAAKGLAGEVETGTIELILSRTLTRIQFAASSVLLALFGLALLVAAFYSGIKAGANSFDLLLPPMIFRRAIFNYFLLFFTIAGLAFALSSFSSERSRVIGLGISFVILQVFMEFFGQSIPKLNFLLYLTIFSCNEPIEILKTRQLNTLHIAILLLIGLGSYLFSVLYFNRRDLIK